MTLLVSASEVQISASIVPNLNRKSARVLSLHSGVRYILKETVLIIASVDRPAHGGIE